MIKRRDNKPASLSPAISELILKFFFAFEILYFKYAFLVEKLCHLALHIENFEWIGSEKVQRPSKTPSPCTVFSQFLQAKFKINFASSLTTFDISSVFFC
jgi:hypothetical protein